MAKIKGTNVDNASTDIYSIRKKKESSRLSYALREQESKPSKNLYAINIMRNKDASVLNSRYTA